MTSEEYKQARVDLGLSLEKWIETLGISLDTHKKFNCGDRVIPLYIQRHIETLLKLKLAK